MSSKLAAARRIAVCLPILAALALAPPVAAKTPAHKARVSAAAPATAATPWLYRGSDVPRDKEWVFGELPNGLRYAVRRNGVPPGQVSIRVRIDAGSLNETESERGYAHFIEHLVFRQSKYLGDAEAIPTFQRLGATFGSDTNAETTPTGTTYKLDLPNVTDEKLDETFKLLSGMMISPALSPSNIDSDRAIVLSEKRDHGGAGARVEQGLRSTIYAGQLLATRDPIGTEETLNAARADSVRAFYRRWYRPDNAVVIVSGDGEPEAFAALIKKWFSDWPETALRTPTPSFGDPVAPADAVKTPATALAPVGETKVMVEPDLPRSITWAVVRPWRPVNDTIVYNQGLMTDALAQAIINRRLEARARAGGSYLTAQVAQQDVSRSTDGTYVSVTPISADWRSAVRDVRGVIADALTTPPTQAEIDREVAEMRVAFASNAEQRSLLPGARVADELVQALDIRETVAAPDAVFKIFERSVPLFTPKAVLAHTRTLFTGTVLRGAMVTPAIGEADAPSLRMALAEPVAADAAARVAYKPISFASLPEIGTATAPTEVAPVGLQGIEQADFANGVKALIWPSEDEPGRVKVKVRFGAGYRAFKADEAPYILLGEMALMSAGFGTLGQEEMDRISTGRKLGFDFGIDDATFTFSADTRREDLNDQLYLFAAKLAMPRWDANPVQRAMAAARMQYEAFATSPQGVIERDLKWIERNRDSRFRMPTPPEVERATPEHFRAVWEPILAAGPVEVQVFGDIDRDATLAALSRSFGALKPRMPLPATISPASRQAPAGGGAPIVLSHHGDANQSAALVFWPTGGGMGGIHESRQLNILSEVFSNRLMDRIREKMGVAYSPQVYSSWPVDMSAGGSIVAVAQLQPKDVPAFYAIADEIVANLVSTPPTSDELARATEPLRQQLNRALTGSAYLMYQLEGATSDPRRYAAISSLLADSTTTSPEQMQRLAAKYLVRNKSWRLAVLPQGQELATQPTGTTARR